MNSRCFLVFAICLLPWVSVAQDLSKSQVINEISYREGGRNVTITEIEPPVFAKKDSDLSSQKSSPVIVSAIVQPHADEALARKTFTVMATTYDHRLTKLTITSHAGGEATEAWSNVNWNHLTPVSHFQGEETFYSMLLLHSNASLKELREARKKDRSIRVPKVPNNLPKLKANGPHYTLTQASSNGQEEILNFLEAIHNQYASQQPELAKAYKLREKQLAKEQKELAENPPKKADFKMIFWNNDANL